MIPIVIIGLGYVGLPLAVEFGKIRPVIGFDINEGRIDALRAGRDSTLEVSAEELTAASQLSFTTDTAELSEHGLLRHPPFWFYSFLTTPHQ